MNFKIKNVLPVFISEPVWSLYIFISGIIMFVYQILYIHFIIRFRLFRVFSYGDLYHSVYLFIHIYHSLSRVIHICTYVSLTT